MKNILLMAILATALTACERPVKRETPTNPNNPNNPSGRYTSDMSSDSNYYDNDNAVKNARDNKYNDYKVKNSNKYYDNDNTAKNARDTHTYVQTPFDQSEADGDLAITQKIRKMLVADDTLSTNGKNIKIITINGVVTLRGPVDSSLEKAAIAKKVGSLPNIKKVNNQLEINKS